MVIFAADSNVAVFALFLLRERRRLLSSMEFTFTLFVCMLWFKGLRNITFGALFMEDIYLNAFLQLPYKQVLPRRYKGERISVHH